MYFEICILMIGTLYRWKNILSERDADLTYWGIYFLRMKRQTGTKKKDSTVYKGKCNMQEGKNRPIPWTVKAIHLPQLMDLAHFPEFRPSSKFHLYPFPKKEVSLYNEVIHTYFKLLYYLSSPKPLLYLGLLLFPFRFFKKFLSTKFQNCG